MEFLRGKSVPQRFFCFLPHLQDLHIPAGILQIICGIVDHGLPAGIVNEICAFIAPKIFGGAGAKTPVSGIGVAHPAEAVMLTLKQMETIGDDLMLRYSVD